MEKRHKACKIALVRDLSYPDLCLWNNAVSIHLQVSYWSEPGFIKVYFNFKNILYMICEMAQFSALHRLYSLTLESTPFKKAEV